MLAALVVLLLEEGPVPQISLEQTQWGLSAHWLDALACWSCAVFEAFSFLVGAIGRDEKWNDPYPVREPHSLLSTSKFSSGVDCSGQPTGSRRLLGFP